MQLAEIEKRLREADNQALHDYRAGTQGPPVLYKASGYLKAIDSPASPMVFIASEESPDRIGDVIQVGGWQLEEFNCNPVLMFAHDYSVPPVGTVPRVWVEGKQLLNTVAWDEADEFAKAVMGKYQRKVMRAESVGFRALDFEEIEDSEGSGGFMGGPYCFKKQELLEISCVPVPMHPHALAKALQLSTPFHILMPGFNPSVAVPIEKPFPSEHSCKLRSPADFQADSFRRSERDHEGKTYGVIMGKLKGESTMTQQSYRYPKDDWEVAEARSHCEAAKGLFEAASGEESMEERPMSKKAMSDMKPMMGKMRELMGQMSDVMDDMEGAMGGEGGGEEEPMEEAATKPDGKGVDISTIRAVFAALKN